MATCRWIKEHLNVLITGASGVGKTWIACALAHQACREGYSALYLRLPRLLHDVALARGDGRYPKLLASLAKLDVLVIDDWGLTAFTPENLRDLLEILEDRYAARSTIVTSQIPVEKWHNLIGEPTFADAILDRLVHNAYKLKLKGGSMRKNNSQLAQADHPEA
jgi:DNA replication protein DnaC